MKGRKRRKASRKKKDASRKKKGANICIVVAVTTDANRFSKAAEQEEA